MATSVASFGVRVLVTAAVLAATVMTIQAPQRQARQAVFVPIALASSNCDPNYEGACVPIASDVDCEGGSGNGPAYVKGPVYVVGDDIYGLDRNKDGVGCQES